MLFKNYNQLIENGQTPELKKKRRDVLDILSAALESVNPYLAIERVVRNGQIVFDAETIDTASFDNVYLVGFGKASIGMAQAVCDSIKITKGAVVTNDKSAKLQRNNIEVVVGGHPIPNNGSIQGAEKILDVVKRCSENDLLIVLISGGGSALLCKPRVSLESIQETTNLLLKSGADINEINTIRKHLSYVKGGQLVKNTKCVVASLIISDIVGDPLEFISSGPTSPDSTTFSDAKKVLETYDLWKEVPDEVRKVIDEGISGKISETPKKDDLVFKQVFNFVVANNEIACKAALEKAKSLGYVGKLLTTSLTGEARDIGRYLLEKAKSSIINESTIFITGGETTVTVKGSGKGGRNLELVLGSIEEIANTDMVLASFATDGIDGNCDAAGAIVDRFTSIKAKEKGLIFKKFLEENDSYGFFSKLNDVIVTGPTGTNVMDIQAIIT